MNLLYLENKKLLSILWRYYTVCVLFLVIYYISANVEQEGNFHWIFTEIHNT